MSICIYVCLNCWKKKENKKKRNETGRESLIFKAFINKYKILLKLDSMKIGFKQKLIALQYIMKKS